MFIQRSLSADIPEHNALLLLQTARKLWHAISRRNVSTWHGFVVSVIGIGLTGWQHGYGCITFL